MNNKALYESIMTNVAKHVKKALNEYYWDWDDFKYDESDIDTVFYYENLAMARPYRFGPEVKRHNDGINDYIERHHEEIIEDEFDEECDAMYKIIDACIDYKWKDSKKALDEYVPKNDMEQRVLPALKKLFDDYINNLWKEIENDEWFDLISGRAQ